MTELKPMTLIHKIILYTIIVFFMFIIAGLVLALVVIIDAPNHENEGLVFFGLLGLGTILAFGGLYGIVILLRRRWKVKIDF